MYIVVELNDMQALTSCYVSLQKIDNVIIIEAGVICFWLANGHTNGRSQSVLRPVSAFAETGKYGKSIKKNYKPNVISQRKKCKTTVRFLNWHMNVILQLILSWKHCIDC